MGVTLRAKSVIVAGAASGAVVATDTPLSLWGGLDPETATVIDRHHPLLGACVAGRIFALPAGRGSCTASGVLLETIRNGMRPAAIVLARPDPIIGLGAILGEELYEVAMPVLVLDPEDFRTLATRARAEISADGTITLEA